MRNKILHQSLLLRGVFIIIAIFLLSEPTYAQDQIYYLRPFTINEAWNVDIGKCYFVKNGTSLPERIQLGPLGRPLKISNNPLGFDDYSYEKPSLIRKRLGLTPSGFNNTDALLLTELGVNSRQLLSEEYSSNLLKLGGSDVMADWCSSTPEPTELFRFTDRYRNRGMFMVFRSDALDIEANEVLLSRHSKILGKFCPLRFSAVPMGFAPAPIKPTINTTISIPAVVSDQTSVTAQKSVTFKGLGRYRTSDFCYVNPDYMRLRMKEKYGVTPLASSTSKVSAAYQSGLIIGMSNSMAHENASSKYKALLPELEKRMALIDFAFQQAQQSGVTLDNEVIDRLIVEPLYNIKNFKGNSGIRLGAMFNIMEGEEAMIEEERYKMLKNWLDRGFYMQNFTMRNDITRF